MPTPTAVRTFLKPETVLREAGIRAGWKVADFGCGPGYYLIPAARFVGPTGRVAGIDLRTVSVDEANRRIHTAGFQDRANVFRADVTQPEGSKLPAAWADLILLIGVLHQSDPRAVLREAARVIKPSDGRIVVVEWEQIATPVGPPPEQRVLLDTVLAAAKSASLVVLSRLAPSPHHYGLVLATVGAEA